jgi:MoxR-like ATPase
MTQYHNDIAAVDALHQSYIDIKNEISKVVIGQDEAVKAVLISIFSNGHCLLVGVPGLAKTLLVQTGYNLRQISCRAIL